MHPKQHQASDRIHSKATTEAEPRTATTSTSNYMSADGKSMDKRPRSPPEEESRSIGQKQTDEEPKVYIKDEHLPYMRELRKNYVSLMKADRQITYRTECIGKESLLNNSF